MDLMKESGSTSLPHLLDGMNYGYWKARMLAFIKSIDERNEDQFYKDGSCLLKLMLKGKLFPRRSRLDA